MHVWYGKKCNLGTGDWVMIHSSLHTNKLKHNQVMVSWGQGLNQDIELAPGRLPAGGHTHSLIHGHRDPGIGLLQPDPKVCVCQDL